MKRKKKQQRVFEDGLIYVFSYKKFKRDTERLGLKRKPSHKRYNGKRIVKQKKLWGVLDCGLPVNIDWCKCIVKGQTK